MINQNDYLELICAAIPRFETHQLNSRQRSCIAHNPAQPLMIVAGPGSGKTTVLVLRAMRLVFVEGILPEQIILTTFTRKAANEIRSRLIEWGLLLIEYLRENPPTGSESAINQWLDTIDVNRFVTGTLDSICEDTLTRFRHPGDPISSVVEGFVANALLGVNGLYPAGARQNPSLDNYLSQFTFNGAPPSNFGEKLQVARTIIDRFVYDQVNLTSYQNAITHTQARQCVANVAQSYWFALDSSNRMDFARLEHKFLDRLNLQRLLRFSGVVKAVLVDEYQDTNPLQESIYFELIRQTGSSFTIVGDDDQSLYRFRGATIELFRDFVSQFQTKLPGLPIPHIEYLVENYRSSPEIVTFFNNFVTNDPSFVPARVQAKPPIEFRLPSNGVPVLGLFRPDRETLANDLVDLLREIFRGDGRTLTINEQTYPIVRNPNGGDFGDAVYLSHTVNEYAASFGSTPPRERLPLMLRQRLSNHGISVFNPRGRALRDIPAAQQLLGTILLCIDPQTSEAPDGIHLASLMADNALRFEAIRNLRNWRQIATSFVNSNPHPNQPHTLEDFIQAWQTRTPQGAMRWPDEWPLLELCFKLIAWMPFLHNDPEGQVYLEAITRAIAQAATFSSYRSMLVFNDSERSARSVRRAITDILAPIAENNVDLDEDIMPSIPRDRLCFMTIHQSKGLEYPLVIVDVSSDYSTNNHLQRFRRFPESPSNVTILENELADNCDIGSLRLERAAIDRTFDDLVRLYYVAFSRPQSVLLLVGLDHCLRYRTSIKHVATGWTRNDTWSWRTNVDGRVPGLANNIPLHLI